ncbi:MAG: hypothetical protein WD512_07090, partial [Candidatus Paceibacterota bacterium]
MNDNDKKIVLDFACKKISRDELFQNLPNYLKEPFLLEKYNEVITSKDKRELEFLRMIPLDNIQLLLPIYRKLILEDWHTENEDIARYFQNEFNEDIENIPILIKAINSVPKYLQYDVMKYPYIRKIIYAIGAQPEPNNIKALERLSIETEDEQIKELALHQIEKRKKLG